MMNLTKNCVRQLDSILAFQKKKNYSYWLNKCAEIKSQDVISEIEIAILKEKKW